MISDFVELCKTDVCFLHIQLIRTNVWLPKTHNVPPVLDFDSSRSPAKSESWNSPNLHCSAVFPTWQYCLYSLVWWIYEINRFRRVSQALVHFVMDGASLFTDHKISGRPILAKSRVWWGWRRHDRRHPRCQIHHRSRFVSDTFSFLILVELVLPLQRCKL